jgi:hypothetical protein
MLGGLFAALRPVLAMVIVGGAAVVMVAPAVEMASQRAESRAATSGQAPLRNDPKPTPHPEDDPNAEPPKVSFETLLRECLDSRDPDSDQCAAAALESGMTYEEFRAKIVAKLEPAKKPEPKVEETKKPEPVVAAKKPEPAKNNDFATYFEKCLATRDLNSDYCFRAEELSGLSREDFDAKFNAKLAAKDSGDFWTVFEKCLDTRNVQSDTCFRAQELIGFNDADFHAKFDRYLAERDAQSAKAKATPKPATAPKDSGDFWTVFEKCLDTRDVRSDTCFRAQQLIGYSDTDFQAKFGRYLAERDAQTGKAKATPKPATGSTTSLDTLLKACGETHNKMSEACLKSLVMSGLQPSDFWAKVEAKFGAFH